MSDERPPGTAAGADEPAGARPLRVLLLDDEPLILMDLEFEMEDAGFVPLGASTARQALAIVEAGPPDAAVLDVNLGHGTTCEAVAARLRELGVPFVIHSGDLDRRGELVARFDAPLLPKPSPGAAIARAVRARIAKAAPGPGGRIAPARGAV